MDVWWERSDELVIGEFKPCIAERAAAEWMECPVEGEATCELAGAGINAPASENDRTAARPADLNNAPVAGQQDAVLGVRLLDKIAITAAAPRDCRVVAGDAQPTAQTRQHLVAEKAQLIRHSQVCSIQPHGRY
jgi:hypothetical protein